MIAAGIIMGTLVGYMLYRIFFSPSDLNWPFKKGQGPGGDK